MCGFNYVKVLLINIKLMYFGGSNLVEFIKIVNKYSY